MTTLLALTMLGTSNAQAVEIQTPHSGTRPHLLDVHLGFEPYGGLGVALGARYGIPIVNNGFVPPINNSVYINFGADIYNTGTYFGGNRGFALGVPVSLQWNFYFTEEWSAFAEAGVNVVIPFGGRFAFGSSFLVTSVGGRYAFNEKLSLHLRLGSPYASVGIEFGF